MCETPGYFIKHNISMSQTLFWTSLEGVSVLALYYLFWLTDSCYSGGASQIHVPVPCEYCCIQLPHWRCMYKYWDISVVNYSAENIERNGVSGLVGLRLTPLGRFNRWKFSLEMKNINSVIFLTSYFMHCLCSKDETGHQEQFSFQYV